MSLLRLQVEKYVNTEKAIPVIDEIYMSNMGIVGAQMHSTPDISEEKLSREKRNGGTERGNQK